MSQTAEINQYYIDDYIKDYYMQLKTWFDRTFYNTNDNKMYQFDSMIWHMHKPYTNNERYRFDFNFLEGELVYLYVDILTFKCYLCNMLLDGYSVSTVYEYYNCLQTIIVSTNGFISISYMSEIELNAICSTDNTNHLFILHSYMDFVINNELFKGDNDIYLRIFKKLSMLSLKLEAYKDNRDLPCSLDISIFQYYLNQFKEETIGTNIYNFFYPLIIWWEITLVIPLRPSEITYTLEKKCLIIKDDACFLKINRIKTSLIKSLQIPLMKEICISNEMYDLINKYAESVAYDTETKTLFSINYLRKLFLDLNHAYPNFDFNSRTFLREYKDYSHFQGSDLNQLIELFYHFYIDPKLGDVKYKSRFRAGDTRHIAFSSLLLQGINPIDIAMLGGHTSLKSLDNYVNHVDLYLDSEIYRYYNNLELNTNTYNRNLKEIIMQMNSTSPNNIKSAIPDEYGVGYCVDNNFNCESDLCFYCKGWWCRPTKQNYIKVIKYIKNKTIKQINKEMDANKKMLHVILTKANVEVIGLNYILPEEYYSKYKQVTKSILSNASQLQKIKESLAFNFNRQEVEERDE